MTSPSIFPSKQVAGGSFLVAEADCAQIFTPEDFTEEQLQIAHTTEQFAENEILPVAEQMERKDWALTRELLRKAGELGLTSADVPEPYGGMGLDRVSSAIISDHISKYGSFSVTFGGHTGIGTLPIVFFGTEQQKQKYLPRLARGESIGAYALSEASAGSDALNVRTRAALSSDGKHYLLNGEKMWTTNAGFADVFIVFAKVDGEKFTAFIVEKNFPGFAIGAEEHKMGLRGSSTCPVIFSDCKVPAENVLGEIGKGHVIAFNILNLGRFKLGAMCVGGARTSLQSAIRYAKQRKAFARPIAEFGLMREKLAQMASLVYAVESMVYRTAGLMDQALRVANANSAASANDFRQALEEYAIECSLIKVAGSEMLSRVVDETVQIHGGYGFVEEYPAERAYRDARVNRIFEGTNEINRLIISGMLLKRAMAGRLPLMPAIQKLTHELLSGPSAVELPTGPLAAERALVLQAKKAVLLAAGAAAQKYLQALPEQQEIMGALADMILDVYAIESCTLRAQKIALASGEESAALATFMTKIVIAGAMERLEAAAKKVLAAAAEGDMLRTHMTVLRRLFKYEPINIIALQQQIAQRLLEAGKYTAGVHRPGEPLKQVA
jgi:alkylation response protein AidB-like acyl-CoA dehydrogenase